MRRKRYCKRCSGNDMAVSGNLRRRGSGDANWGCILDTKRLSERLGELGLAKIKEIVLFKCGERLGRRWRDCMGS